MDDYLEDGNKKRYTGWSYNNFEKEESKRANTIVFSEHGEGEGEIYNY